MKLNLGRHSEAMFGQYSEARFGQDFNIRFSRDADVSDEDHVGNSLLQIWELTFGPKAKLLFRL